MNTKLQPIVFLNDPTRNVLIMNQNNRSLQLTQIDGAGQNINLSENGKIFFNSTQYQNNSQQEDQVYIDLSNNRSNILIDVSQLNNQAIDNFTIAHLTNTTINGYNIADYLQNVNTLMLQMASTGSVQSGLQGQLQILFAQMASTAANKVRSGLQDQIDNIQNGGQTQEVNTLIAQMASTGIPNAGNVASGLQAQLTTHDMQLGQDEYKINDLRNICASLQQQIYGMKVYYPGQIVAIMSNNPQIQVSGNVLRLMDGTTTLTQYENAQLYALFGGSNNIANIPDCRDAGLFASSTFGLGTFIGANFVRLNVSQLPPHKHAILQGYGALFGAQDASAQYGGLTGQININGGQTDNGEGQMLNNPVPTVPRSICVNWYICIM